ncbi:hypothetical protein [Bradyrhizobium roseum]|uniref:hypothetical protein n=1 Tax=Bradyrhizobium roseum TaxID=3056648 RepID=UPI00262CDEC9|nr:hypothetical protein [Bradyrhizobium roseus]WKA29826.1 hypothetical protein QUH67_06525 [Bradyrhizobium roseus]
MGIPLNEWNGSKEVSDKLESIQKQNAGQQRLMLGLTAVAAVAAIIAAWPVIKEWIALVK